MVKTLGKLFQITMTNDEGNLKEMSEVEVVEVIDKFEKLEPEQKQQIITTMEMYNGPIPHPNILKGYEELDVGSAKKIIDNGIGESTHRRSIENKIVSHNAHQFYVKYFMAFFLCLIFIGLSFYLILNDHKIIGSVFAGTSFLIIIGMFLGDNSNESIAEKNQPQNEEN